MKKVGNRVLVFSFLFSVSTFPQTHILLQHMADPGPCNIWPFADERKPKASELYYQVMDNKYKNKQDEYGPTDVNNLQLSYSIIHSSL